MDVKTEWSKHLYSRCLLSDASLWTRLLGQTLPLQHRSPSQETGRLECSAQGGPKLLSLSPGTTPNTAWVLGRKPKPFQSLEIRMQECMFVCMYAWELDYSVVCSLFFSWVLEILEINLSVIRARLRLLLIIKQHCCLQEYCIVYLSYINNNSYFLWLWILHVKANLQSTLLIFSILFAASLK